MTNSLVSGMDKMSNSSEQLRSTLRAVEEKHIGELSPEVAQARNCVLEVLPTYATARVQFGRVLYGYKRHFKALGGWVAAARAIAGVVGCSEKGIYRIARYYEQIEGLDPIFLEVLEGQSVDPAAPKNAEIVAQLFDVPAPVTKGEAAETVARIVRDDHQRRRIERDTRKAEREKRKSDDRAKLVNEAKENENQPAGQMLDTSNPGAAEAADAFAIHIADLMEKRLQRVAASERIAEVSRMLLIVGKTLGVLVTVENLPSRGKLPANTREPSQAA